MNTRLKKRAFPATALVNLMLCIGLFLIVYGLLTDKPIVALGAICAPIGIIVIGYGFVNPRYTYILYTIYAYFFICFIRILRHGGLSVGQDILHIYMVCTLLFTIFLNRNSSYTIKNAANGLTICYLIWVVFILFQMLNPGTDSEGIVRGFRTLIVGNTILYIVLSMLSNTPKFLKTFLILWGILTVIAFLKLMYQRYVGFDQAEKYWLFAQGGSRTHIISTGIRYFSVLSDAGNFGVNMGAMFIMYAIISIYTKNKSLRLFFIAVAIMGLIGMLMAGTRSALAVPFGGLALYCLLCKNLKIFATTAIIGILSFSFLAFTDIGESNSLIRRMRTAVRPNIDASFNVRKNNRVMIAEHLKDKPFGVGTYQSIPKLWSNDDGTYEEGTLPPDSYFVNMWIQHGIVGLLVHIFMYMLMLAWASYLILFRITNRQLRQVMAAFIGTVFGILLNGYAGEGMGLPPTNLLLVALLAFAMNGPYIDKQLTNENNNYIL